VNLFEVAGNKIQRKALVMKITNCHSVKIVAVYQFVYLQMSGHFYTTLLDPNNVADTPNLKLFHTSFTHD